VVKDRGGHAVRLFEVDHLGDQPAGRGPFQFLDGEFEVHWKIFFASRGRMQSIDQFDRRIEIDSRKFVLESADFESVHASDEQPGLSRCREFHGPIPGFKEGHLAFDRQENSHGLKRVRSDSPGVDRPLGVCSGRRHLVQRELATVHWRILLSQCGHPGSQRQRQ
jgi:hypothetical protein